MILFNTKLKTHTINPEHSKQLMNKKLKVFYFGTRQARRARSSVMAAESMFMRRAEGGPEPRIALQAYRQSMLP